MVKFHYQIDCWLLLRSRDDGSTFTCLIFYNLVLFKKYVDLSVEKCVLLLQFVLTRGCRDYTNITCENTPGGINKKLAAFEKRG